MDAFNLAQLLKPNTWCYLVASMFNAQQKCLCCIVYCTDGSCNLGATCLSCSWPSGLRSAGRSAKECASSSTTCRTYLSSAPSSRSQASVSKGIRIWLIRFRQWTHLSASIVHTSHPPYVVLSQWTALTHFFKWARLLLNTLSKYQKLKYLQVVYMLAIWIMVKNKIDDYTRRTGYT